MSFLHSKHRVGAAHLQTLVCSRQSTVTCQQLLKRGVGQKSGIRDLKWFVQCDLLVLLASSSRSSPSTAVEVPLHQGFVCSLLRQD